MLDVVPGWSPDAGITRVPRAALPPGASVIAFSPLLDAEFVEVLRDLRQRGFPVVVVDVLNVELGGGAPGWTGWPGASGTWSARPLSSPWASWGSPVVAWDGEGPLALPGRRHKPPGRRGPG